MLPPASQNRQLPFVLVQEAAPLHNVHVARYELAVTPCALASREAIAAQIRASARSRSLHSSSERIR
jgi:hypothetical protein